MVLLGRLTSRRGNRLHPGRFRSREPSRYDLPLLLKDFSLDTGMQEFPTRLLTILGTVTTSSCGRVLKLECLFILTEQAGALTCGVGESYAGKLKIRVKRPMGIGNSDDIHHFFFKYS